MLVAALAAAAAAADPGVGPAETVVLLHGLGRTDRSMRSLELRLSAAGFQVENLRYPSTEQEPEALVEGLGAQLARCCSRAPRLDFVTHSLGGILLRAYLASHRPSNLGRVVMLSPPNHGSEIVDVIGDSELFEWALGPTARQLGTDDSSLPNRLPPPDYEVGIITGDVSINPAGAALIPGANDGSVSVASARLAGMTDFLVVPHSHTFIMRADDVALQVIEFLRHGRFRHDAP